MNFRRETPSDHYRELRLLSQEEKWEVGFSLYAAGMRLRMGVRGRPPHAFDFCLGRDAAIYLPVLDAVLRKLRPLEEEISMSEINAVFPWAAGRPDLSVHLEALLAE